MTTDNEIKIFWVSLSNGETLFVRADGYRHALNIAKRKFNHADACLASQVYIHEDTK